MSRNNPNDLKQQILELASRMFHDYGYEGTTFQKMADELGITKGAITYHFGNKYKIMDILFQQYFDMLHAYINSFQEPYGNAYWSNCVVYIYAYRLILSSERNRNLFYHENQMSLWEQNKVPQAVKIHTDIVRDFHCELDENEILTNVYIDLGARRRLYREYLRGNPYLQDTDGFIYSHIRLIGLLCHLDMDTITKNCTRAFEFANSHEAPLIPMLVND